MISPKKSKILTARKLPETWTIVQDGELSKDKVSNSHIVSNGSKSSQGSLSRDPVYKIEVTDEKHDHESKDSRATNQGSETSKNMSHWRIRERPKVDEMPRQMVESDQKSMKFDQIFSPDKDDFECDEYIITDVEMNESHININEVPYHQEDPELSPTLWGYLGIIHAEEEQKISNVEVDWPECIKPIVKYLKESPTDELWETWLFKINEETDNLILNENNFSFYTKYTTEEIINNDEETKFLCGIKTKEGYEVEISQYLIMKSDALLDCSFDKAVDLLSNPEKYKVFNPNMANLEKVCDLSSLNAWIYHWSLKSYSYWYLPRDYILINHHFSLNGTAIIVEKSVEHTEALKSVKNVMADVHLKITLIEPKSGTQTRIKEYYVVDYGGYGMTSSQCCQMALKERFLVFKGIF